MSLEKEIVLYLVHYGNTREKDIIDYSVQNLGRSSKHMKKVINRMVINGKIHRILHDRITPPEVYISLEEPFSSDVLKALIGANVSDAAKEDVQKILEEAAEIAEKRTGEIDLREH